MLLGFLTVLIMAIVAYAFWREGPLTAFGMSVNVVIAGLLAFNFYEPIADLMEPAFSGSFLEGIEDALALMLIFLPVLGLLRWASNTLASTHLEYPPVLYRAGGVVFGLLTGYLVAGFLVCMLQTLPVNQNFLGFETYEPGKSPPLRSFMPPDLVWLAMLHRLSGAGLSADEAHFDQHANFELRYGRFRRWDENGKTLPWRGEVQP